MTDVNRQENRRQNFTMEIEEIGRYSLQPIVGDTEDIGAG